LRKLTQIEAREAAEAQGFRLISEYANNRTRATFECPAGHVWDALPRNVLGGSRGCPHCSGRVKLSKHVVNDRLV